MQCLQNIRFSSFPHTILIVPLIHCLQKERNTTMITFPSLFSETSTFERTLQKKQKKKKTTKNFFLKLLLQRRGTLRIPGLPSSVLSPSSHHRTTQPLQRIRSVDCTYTRQHIIMSIIKASFATCFTPTSSKKLVPCLRSSCSSSATPKETFNFK